MLQHHDRLCKSGLADTEDCDLPQCTARTKQLLANSRHLVPTSKALKGPELQGELLEVRTHDGDGVEQWMKLVVPKAHGELSQVGVIACPRQTSEDG